MTKNRVFSAVLAALLAASAFAACSEQAQTPAPDTAAQSPTEVTDAAEETTESEDGYIPDDIPDTDFGGDTVNILATSWYESGKYVGASELDGEVINDALYNQRMNIQERFNVNVSLTQEGNIDEVCSNVHRIALAGDNSYDIAYNHDIRTVTGAMRGDFLDIRSIDTIDFSKPWFKGTTDILTVGGKLFFDSNNFALSGEYMNITLAINKDFANNHGIAIPYDKARAGTWYMDDLIAMNADLAQDINGDGKMTEDDQYGFLTSYYPQMGIQSNLGGTVVEKDEDGMLELVFNESRLVSILEKAEKLYLSGVKKLDDDSEGGARIFVKNNSLFIYVEARVLYNTVRSYDITYGILPFPKMDETQQDYASAGFDIYWGVLSSAGGRADMIGTIVSAMSCYNYNNIVPMIWELILGSKLADAPDDAEMFEIIRDVRYVDLSYAFSGASSQLSNLVFLIGKAKSDSVMSYIESNKEGAQLGLETVNTTFRDM